MKPTLLAALAAALAIGSAAQAGADPNGWGDQNPARSRGLRCDTFGDFTSCTGPGGYTSRESTFDGDWTTGADSLGNTWRTERFGDMTTTQVTPGSRQQN